MTMKQAVMVGVVAAVLGLGVGLSAAKVIYTVSVDQGALSGLLNVPADAAVTVTQLGPEAAPLKLLVTTKRPGDAFIRLQYYTMDVAPPLGMAIDEVPTCSGNFIRVETAAGIGCVPPNHPLALGGGGR
jgi:hypothetical protein